MQDLMSFMNRRECCLASGQSPPIIIPFFYRLGVPELLNEPRLDRIYRDGTKLYGMARFYERLSNGKPELDIAKIKNALRTLPGIMGVRNVVGANNDITHLMTKRREWLLDQLTDVICRIKYQYQVDPTTLEKALQDGTAARLDTVRLMVLGAPSRGKTSTIASLRRKPFDYGRESTKGIELSIHYIPVGDHSLSDEQIKRLDTTSKFQVLYRKYQEQQNRHILAADNSSANSSNEIFQLDLNSSSTPATNTGPDSPSTEPVLNQIRDIAGKETENSEVAIPECTTLRCWDFGGQPEYEVAHELFISPRSIVMFVLDLLLLESMDTRDDEVRRLQLWVQTVFAMTPEDELGSTFGSILIVGTKKDKCRNLGGLFDILRIKLSTKLDSKITKQWNMNSIKMIAIENEKALEDIHRSGLSELEEHLELTAKTIIERGAEVPLRWLALLELLRERYDEPEWKSFSMSQHDVERISTGLSFSSTQSEGVNEEVYTCLKYLRNLGEVVLFNVDDHTFGRDDGSYMLFPKPEVILKALKTIVAPKDDRCKGLSDREDIRKIEQGILTSTALQEKWGELRGLSSKEDHNNLLSLMTSKDIFITLKSSGEHGVPSLLEKTCWDNLKWLCSNSSSEREVHTLTEWEGFIPFGFVGTFVGRLHRTIGNAQTDIRLLRRNAVLLTPGDVQPETGDFQIFVGFKHEKRELHWVVRGRSWNFDLLAKCLSEFEDHKRERLIGRTAVATHYILTGCPQRDCDKKFGLKFKIPFDYNIGRPLWLSEQGAAGMSYMPSGFPRATCDNIDCSKRATLNEAIENTEASGRPGALRSPKRAKYEVFISHAGPDKSSIARPLYDKLKEKEITSFLDEKELRIGHEAEPEMVQGMNEAPILVAITSPEFCVRKWPIIELGTFVKRHKELSGQETRSSHIGSRVQMRYRFSRNREQDKKVYLANAKETWYCTGLLAYIYRLYTASEARGRGKTGQSCSNSYSEKYSFGDHPKRFRMIRTGPFHSTRTA